MWDQDLPCVPIRERVLSRIGWSVHMCWRREQVKEAHACTRLPCHLRLHFYCQGLRHSAGPFITCTHAHTHTLYTCTQARRVAQLHRHMDTCTHEQVQILDALGHLHLLAWHVRMRACGHMSLRAQMYTLASLAHTQKQTRLQRRW